MSKPILTNHAWKRAQQRGITRSQIDETVDQPDTTLAARPGAKTGSARSKHLRAFGNRTLCAVVETRGTRRIVITCYWKD